MTDFAAPAHIDQESIIPRLESLLRRLAARRRVRHVVVGAADLDGSWSWADSVGSAGRDGAAMQPDTPWFLASVTKLYIATVILRLVEGELVNLQTPITAYLPAEMSGHLHVYDNIDYTDQITVTHLLGHLTGLPDYLDERPRGQSSLMEVILDEGDQAWSAQDAVVRARDLLTPHFPPSDPGATRPTIRYSDTNFQLLIVIAEHVTGRAMSELYTDLLFEPLGLKGTWLPARHSMNQPTGVATIWVGDRPLVDRPLAMGSFGDLYSTTDDVLRFGRALFSGEIFGNRATGDLMRQRFNRFGFPRGMSSLRAPSWPIEYGLGIMRFELSRLLAGGRRLPALLGHTGSTGSWLWYVPEFSVLITGTVDQAAAATVPFRSVPRALTGLKPATAKGRRD